jgi:hypothetical protein
LKPTVPGEFRANSLPLAIHHDRRHTPNEYPEKMSNLCGYFHNLDFFFRQRVGDLKMKVRETGLLVRCLDNLHFLVSKAVQ